MSEISGLELLKTRRSIRSYDERPIEENILKEIFEATKWCFSAVNRQPWSFIVIRNKELIQKIAMECTTGPFASQAPVLVAVVGDKEIQPDWYIHDLSFVTLQLALSAWAFGIGTCWIGIFNRDVIHKLLNLTEKDYLMTIMPLGYPKGSIPKPRPRKSFEELVNYID
ncbi:MAG: nitroreductase family protein [Candidatus Thorarchaeota archaeon]